MFLVASAQVFASEKYTVCTVSGATKGEFKLGIAKVYDNPSLDGKTVGKVIAKDLTWTQDDHK